jgi:hypothetical protein
MIAVRTQKRFANEIAPLLPAGASVVIAKFVPTRGQCRTNFAI